MSSSDSGCRASTRLRQSSGLTTEKNGFSVVAAIRLTIRSSTARQQGVLLGLGEAVHLVDEQHGAAAGVGELALGGGDDRPDLLDAGVERGQLDELPLGGQRDDVRERRLAGAGRAVEDQRHRLVGLDQPAQRRPRAEQVLLADDLVERPRPHPDGERRAGVDGAGPSSSGASNSEVTVAKLPAGHDTTRAAATHRRP